MAGDGPQNKEELLLKRRGTSVARAAAVAPSRRLKFQGGGGPLRKGSASWFSIGTSRSPSHAQCPAGWAALSCVVLRPATCCRWCPSTAGPTSNVNRRQKALQAHAEGALTSPELGLRGRRTVGGVAADGRGRQPAWGGLNPKPQTLETAPQPGWTSCGAGGGLQRA